MLFWVVLYPRCLGQLHLQFLTSRLSVVPFVSLVSFLLLSKKGKSLSIHTHFGLVPDRSGLGGRAEGRRNDGVGFCCLFFV